MGGLRKKMPFAFLAMLTGVLSICGIPRFSGFFSKDAVIYGALAHGHPWLYAVGIVTAGITAYYMFRLLFVTFFGEYRGDAHIRTAARPRWVMNVPVAILVAPTVAIGGGADVRRRSSPWARYFAPLFGARGGCRAVAGAHRLQISEGRDFAARVRSGRDRLRDCVDALRDRRPRCARRVERLRSESGTHAGLARQSVLLRHASSIWSSFARRSCSARSSAECSIRTSSTAPCAKSPQCTRWLGTLVRSLQTGLVRAYALILVFGAACFIVVLRARGRTALMGLVLVTILLPIVAGRAAPRAAARRPCPLARGRHAGRAGHLRHADRRRRNGEWSFRWLSRPFDAAFHFGATPISFWIALLLALCTACAIAACRVPRTRNFVALLLLLEGSMLGPLPRARSARLRALLGSHAGAGLFRPDRVGRTSGDGMAILHLQLRRRPDAVARDRGLRRHLRFDRRDRPQRRAPRRAVGRRWIFAGFAFAFLVKTPVWPLHTWMPPTYSGLPSPMVAVVSAVQSKAGLYGFLAIALALAPGNSGCRYRSSNLCPGARALSSRGLGRRPLTAVTRVRIPLGLPNLRLYLRAFFIATGSVWARCGPEPATQWYWL